MAFTVSPTSGAAPYVLTADISDKESLFWDRYALELRTRSSSGSCATPIMTSPPNNVIGAALLESGTSTLVADVPIGSCQVFSLVIRDLETDLIISQEVAQVSNLE